MSANNKLKVHFLGTGTSTGVPEIGCKCKVCQSGDTRDKRLRTSALLQIGEVNILIDCSPDFREQMLRYPVERIDAVLLTHEHYDHVGGLDDLRPFTREKDVEVYANRNTAEALRNRLAYMFRANKYPGVPQINLLDVGDAPFNIQGIEVQPIEVMHHKLPILGYRIGKMAYITDMKTIAPQEQAKLCDLDVLIVNALRWEEHLSHQTVSQALEFSAQVGAKHTYFIHMNHHVGLHAEIELQLPENVYFAFDGMTLEID